MKLCCRLFTSSRKSSDFEFALPKLELSVSHRGGAGENSTLERQLPPCFDIMVSTSPHLCHIILSGGSPPSRVVSSVRVECTHKAVKEECKGK